MAAPMVRLDGLVNPYGPVLAAREALATRDADHPAAASALEEVTEAIARHIGLPRAWVRLWSGTALGPPAAKPVLRLPPAGELPTLLADDAATSIRLWRGEGFRPDLDLESVSELPSGAWAEVAVPHDPSGALLPIQGAVRLTRGAAMVVIDERLGGYGPRSFVMLAREYDTVVVAQSLAGAAGLGQWDRGWVVGSPRALAQLPLTDASPWTRGEVLAHLATLADWEAVEQQVRRVREERSRLFRMVRKFNLLTPIPSWAGFLLCRVERGSAEQVARLLDDRGVRIHVPNVEGTGEFIRIGVGTPHDTDRLREALVDVANAL